MLPLLSLEMLWKLAMAPLHCALEPDCLHILHHLQQSHMPRACKDGIVSVKNVDATVPDEEAPIPLDETNAIKFLTNCRSQTQPA